jgi:hypothetical protein
MVSDPAIHPLTLEFLFGTEGIVADENGDGYPDRLKVCIGVEPGLSDAGVWAQVLNLAARLAGEVTALDLPLVKAMRHGDANRTVLVVHKPLRNHPFAAELRRSGKAVHLSGSSAARMAEVVYSLAVHAERAKGRRGPWSFLRVTETETGVVEAWDRRGKGVGRFLLSPVCPAAEKPRVEHFDLLDLPRSLYRPSAENPRDRELALTIELFHPRLSFQVGLALAELVVASALEATKLELPLAAAIVGSDRLGGVVLRVEEHPGRGARLAVEPAESEGRVVVRAEGGSGSLACLLQDWKRFGLSTEGPADDGVRRLRGRLDAALAMIDGCGAPSARVAPASIRQRRSWRSETERLIEAVQRVPPGRGAIQGLALISRPLNVRMQVRREITTILAAKGYAPAVEVLNAYKPGLSWLREVVQPELKAIPQLERVQIAFRKFTSDRTALEMRSRWLQELYPGPDLLAAALKLPLERVRFLMRSRLGEAYVVTAWDRNGTRIYQSGFTPRVSRLPYLPGHPELGWVHPCTGGIRLIQSDRVLMDESLSTDREHFWLFFQQSILPALESSMAERLADRGRGLPPAFWGEAVIDVRIPETDERLGLGEERIAPMEALHEDIYFGLLDHFQLFAEKHELPPETQFGRILPRVSTDAPGGRPETSFLARSFTRLLQTGVSGRDPAFSADLTLSARIVSIGLEAGHLSFEIAAARRAAAIKPAKELCRSARSGSPEAAIAAAFILRTSRPQRRAERRHEAFRKASRAAPPLNRLLSLREVEQWVGRLGDRPRLHAWQAGRSWQGRPIWALEAVLAGGGSLVSAGRLRLLKPTLLMNARHHANEVSSTNAALRLAWELAATAWGGNILKRVNVAIVPIENVDGVATLGELLLGCAGHKLHAARYNALGVEWYGDYFLERPRFPEARVKPLLWRRWLPLLVLDAHGVPSHEWDQPFAGYAPGRFRPYWIPRAFIYAIVPFIKEISHPGHRPAREISKVMERAVRADQEIQKLDRELKDRYVRYARAWEREVFPPTGGRGLTVLPSEKRLAGMNFGVQRFPVTVSEIVTEVTDEVVSGRLLGLCARAHMTAAKALLEWLGRQPPGRLVRKRMRGGGLVLSWEAGKKDPMVGLGTNILS